MDKIREAGGADRGGSRVNQTELALLCHGLQTNSPAPLMDLALNQQTILDLMAYYVVRVKDFMNSAMRLVPYVEAELLAMLTKIDECGFFSLVRFYQQVPPSPLDGLVPSLYEFFRLSDELRELVLRRYGVYWRASKGCP